MEINDGTAILLLSDTIEDKGTILGDPTIQNIETQMENQELQQLVHNLLSTLSPREQEVLKLLYGIDNYPVLSRNEIAKIIGVREEQVSRIKIKAVQRLRDIIIHSGN
jgi:RNA polymerase primary sigma factor